MTKYKCLVCGEEFEVEDGQEPICPTCGVGKENLEEIK